MADTKISALTALTGANLAAGDLAVVVDTSDTTMSADGTDKKMTITELIAGLEALGVGGEPDAMDVPGVAFATEPLEGSGGWTANTAYFKRFTVHRKTVVNRVGLYGVSGTGGNIDVGVYADDGTGTAPGSRVVSSGATATVAGVQYVTITDTTLDPGAYWLAFATPSTSLNTPRSTANHLVWALGSQSKASSYPLPASVSALTTNAAVHGCWLENR